MDSLYIILCVMLDMLVLLTLPLYALILYATSTVDPQETGRTFLICLRHLSICLLVHCSISLLVNEPANLGVHPEFLQANAFWLGKISYIGQLGFFAQSALWMFVLALTRFSVIRSAASLDRGAAQLQQLGRVVWVLSLGAVVPIVYPIETDAAYKWEDSLAYQLGLSTTVAPLRIFYNIFTLLPNVLVGLSILFYIVIFGYLPALLRNGNERSRRVYRVTVAAMLSCTGGLVTAIAVAIEQVPWLVAGARVWPVGAFYFFFKLGSDLHSIGFAWVTLFMFRKIRRQLLVFLGLVEQHRHVAVIRISTTNTQHPKSSKGSST